MSKEDNLDTSAKPSKLLREKEQRLLINFQPFSDVDFNIAVTFLN